MDDVSAEDSVGDFVMFVVWSLSSYSPESCGVSLNLVSPSLEAEIGAVGSFIYLSYAFKSDKYRFADKLRRFWNLLESLTISLDSITGSASKKS